MTYKELTEKMSKENLSQMEGSDEMLRRDRKSVV